MKRVSCRDMARELEVSHSTISLALRNHPSIPTQTRERVQTLAAQWGYRPDPALSGLNAYRQANRPVAFKSALAWVNRYPEGKEPRYLKNYFEGARERASALGYNIEIFWVENPERWRVLPRMLTARGIEGILLPPLACRETDKDVQGQSTFPWENFFAIALAQSTESPALHVVVNDQYQGAAIVVQELYALGYRKIGMVMPFNFAIHTDFRFLGGYSMECTRLKLPALALLDESTNEADYQKHVVRWLREKKPEVVIASGTGDILPVLEQAKLKVPEDIGVAFLAQMPDKPHISHLNQNEYWVGVESANQLTDLIRRNERGISKYPTRLLVEGFWQPAGSTPPRQESAAPLIAPPPSPIIRKKRSTGHRKSDSIRQKFPPGTY